MSRKDKATQKAMREHNDRLETTRLSIMKDCGRHI